MGMAIVFSYRQGTGIELGESKTKSTSVLTGRTARFLSARLIDGAVLAANHRRVIRRNFRRSRVRVRVVACGMDDRLESGRMSMSKS